MPQMWKIARELDRLGQQAKAAAGIFYEPILKWRHDRTRLDRLKLVDGDVTPAKKLAVFLIYQPNGVLASTLAACRYLQAKGYAPLIVSNTPLTDGDLARLRPLAWKIMLRPNYGYDFGGYRDGIFMIDHLGLSPDRLIILNDSIWLPVLPGSDLIDRLEAMPADLAGAIEHRSSRRKGPFGQFLKARRWGFLESYLYLVNRRTLEHPAFRAYWRDYRVSSTKYNAVYRGERGFSRAMEKAGLTVAGLFSADRFVALMEDQPAATLRETLSYGAYTDPDFQAEADRLIAGYADTRDWRTEVLAHIATTVQKRNFHASFPYASLNLLGVPFLKKSANGFQKTSFGTLHNHMRRQYLRAVESGAVPEPEAEILVEIEARAPVANAGVSHAAADFDPDVRQSSRNSA